MIRIWFFGTPELSATVLSDILADQRFEIAFIVTNPDKPFGRDQLLRMSPVKELGIMKEIPILQPIKIRWNDEFLENIRSYECDYYVIVAYWKILPLELLEMPKKMCINIHGSILPSYRGASPIQSALLCGEKETWVTIMRMSEWMDEGDILKIRYIPIDPRETSLTLFAKFAAISGSTLMDAIMELEHGWITPLPQDHTMATYCKKIDKEDWLIDWNQPAKNVFQMWQAYTPWPGIFTHYEWKRLILEIIDYKYIDISSEVLIDWNIWEVVRLDDNSVGIICVDWVLTLEQVKLEWKKSQSIKDFINGNQKFIWYNFL